jgi:cysteine synthase
MCIELETVRSTARWLKDAGSLLPTFAQLRDPSRIPEAIVRRLKGIRPDDAHPLNLFRVHWYNDVVTGGFLTVPEHVVLPPALTGVDAVIVVLLGDTFPLIGAHKVLPAYACLVTRLASGHFDPSRHRAVWPSTGNYCRGGVAISRILGCRSVAVLPEGMSRERFEWLERWVTAQEDIVKTPGSESNLREIYQKCAELQRDSANIIINQFADFANYLAHYSITGAAAGAVYESLRVHRPELRLAAFVAGTGSSGTLGAGDYLKATYAARIAAVEPLECPTLLSNGYGEHNIQGIGDKHVPLIHNVMNTDMVVGVSDKATDALNVLFNTASGQEFLASHIKVPRALAEGLLRRFGLSSIANILGSIKVARFLGLSSRDVIVTIATDGAELYQTEMMKTLEAAFAGRFDEIAAAEAYGRHLAAVTVDNVEELSLRSMERIFNLGYYTWVEQQGVPLNQFERRRDPTFWDALKELIPRWDGMIDHMNRSIAESAETPGVPA